MPIWNFCTLHVSSGNHLTIYSIIQSLCNAIMRAYFDAYMKLLHPLCLVRLVLCNFDYMMMSVRKCQPWKFQGIRKYALGMQSKIWDFENEMSQKKTERKRIQETHYKHNYVPTRIVHSWVQKSANFILENCIFFAHRSGLFLPGHSFSFLTDYEWNNETWITKTFYLKACYHVHSCG